MAPHFRIDGRYEIIEVLGSGGMGIVYKAYDAHRRGYVALKTMKDAADPGVLAMFAQEWTTLANISHPNIVDVLASGEFQEEGHCKPYFVMPLLPGRPLDKLLREAGHDLTVPRVVEIIVQTCRGLQAAHGSGLIHRDLKPSNIFVMNDDSVKIIDFGMVYLADVKKSITGIKGTLQYMSPEQIEMKDLTPATDIFSLGVVCYEALTGRKPFDGGSAAGTAQAIRHEFPPPASDLKPSVNKLLGQVVAKAMAKGPWNRFASAREFGDHLQKALKGEPIDAFDPAKIQPRVERVRRALGEGDLEYAHEILNELQSEGHVDSGITLLLQRVRQEKKAKGVKLLLDSARTRLQEGEYPLAWQKVQEALHKDPTNTEAQALQAEIETRRSEEQMDKWRSLVRQHIHNHAFREARQAIEEIRKISLDSIEVAELTAAAERGEKQFQKVCEEKEQHYQSAMRAYGSGEISTALSKLEKILELAGRAPGFIVPGRDEVYRETYDKIRSEWESIRHAVAEVEKTIAAGNLARAAELCDEYSTKYPADFPLQALKLKVDDLLRQQKSEYIAEVTRQVDAEPDLDRAVRYLEGALERYPHEPHFEELTTVLRRRRDFVNSIVAKARQYEEQNLISDAMGQWTTLRGIHPHYPGLDFEIERIQRRLEHHRREEAKLNWVDQIDRLLQTGKCERAYDVAVTALDEFPNDPELQSLKQLALEGWERNSEALKIVGQAELLSSERQFEAAIQLLRRAVELDPNNGTVRANLANVLAEHARTLLIKDWRSAEPLLQEALRIAPAHTVAKSLRPALLLAQRMEFIDQCIEQARELQLSGDIAGALGKVQQGLISYPNDARLVQLQSSLTNTIGDQAHLRRARDLEELKQISMEIDRARDQTSLTALLKRSVALSEPYPQDEEFSVAAKSIRQRASSGERAGATEAPGAADDEKNNAGQSANKRWQVIASRAVAAWGSSGAGKIWSQLLLKTSALWQLAVALPRRTDWGAMGRALKHPQIGRFTLKPIGLTAFTALAVVLVIFAIIRPGSVPATPKGAVSPPHPVTFAVTPEGTSIIVDGKPLSGSIASLEPGPHSVTAVKAGYRTAKQHFTIDNSPRTVSLNLQPEPQTIRIAAEVADAKVFLNDKEIGGLQDGAFSYDLAGTGPHKLKVITGKTEIFSVDFIAEPGRPATLVSPPLARGLPVVVVSSLGPIAFVHSSTKEMRMRLRGEEPRRIPLEGSELTLAADTNEVTFDDGSRPVSLPVEIDNAPVLSIAAGPPTRGLLTVEADVDGATVYVNGQKTARAVQSGKWRGSLGPGDHKVRLTMEGYDDSPEQVATIVAGKPLTLKFGLKRLIRTAFLRIEGGTPEADVLLDGQQIGKLDSGGSLGPIPVAPDTVHAIRLVKADHEDTELRLRAPVKETIVIAARDARLRPFGTIEFEVQPPEVEVTIQRQGDPPRPVKEKSINLPQGTYVVSGKAGGYKEFRSSAQVKSGEHVTIRVVLARIEESKPVTAGKPAEPPDLFGTSDKWRRLENGLWFHDGPLWLSRAHFRHVFDIPRVKRSLGRTEKVQWQIHLQDGDYIACELDGSDYSRKIIVRGKPTESFKKRHGVDAGLYRLEIAVEPNRVLLTVGQASDVITRKVEGRTYFPTKFTLRLIE